MPTETLSQKRDLRIYHYSLHMRRLHQSLRELYHTIYFTFPYSTNLFLALRKLLQINQAAFRTSISTFDLDLRSDLSHTFTQQIPEFASNNVLCIIPHRTHNNGFLFFPCTNTVTCLYNPIGIFLVQALGVGRSVLYISDR